MSLAIRSRKILSLAILGSLFLGIGVAGAAPEKPNKQKEAIDFWTADKIKKAQPFEMVFEAGSKVAKRVPQAKGTTKAPKGGNQSSVLGASWNNGGLPLEASGKVFFAYGTSSYQCSGALVRDGSKDISVILTAGHCVYDNALTKYADYWIFIPNYDINRVSISGCAAAPGCWPASALFAHSGFTNETGFTSNATLFDWGFATITPKNGLLPDKGDGSNDGANSFPINFASLNTNTQVSSFGYPAAGKYNGTDLVYSSGLMTFDSNNANNTYRLASDMTGGCSGGPWLSAMATSNPYNGTLSSVNSYKYRTTTSIYGPKFNLNTKSTFNLAGGIG